MRYKLGFNSEFVYSVNLFNKLVLTSRDSVITNNAKSDSDASKQNFSRTEMHPFEQYRMEISFPVLTPELQKTLYRHANKSNLNYTPYL